MADILLLEDEYFLLRLYTKALQAAGHTVTGALTREAAFDEFAKQPFDVFIADIRIGRMDAYEHIRQLGQLQQQSDCQFLIISAQLPLYIQACDEAGLLHRLAKPFSNQRLVSAVASLLRGDTQDDSPGS